MKQALIVDDDSDIVELLRKLLSSYGFTVRVAPNGREALRCVARAVPDVIFLDVMMPGADGRTVLAELRRNALLDGTKVAMVTACDTASEISEARRMGADAYITKPFRARDVMRSVGMA